MKTYRIYYSTLIDIELEVEAETLEEANALANTPRYETQAKLAIADIVKDLEVGIDLDVDVIRETCEEPE